MVILNHQQIWKQTLIRLKNLCVLGLYQITQFTFTIYYT